MNGFEERNKTLGELRRRLRARLGFAVQGPAAENNRDVLNDILQEAHEFIAGEVDASGMRKKCILTLSPGSYLYDWHNDLEDENIDPSHVFSIWVMVGDTRRDPLIQGITERHREQSDLRDFPLRYDTLNGQMELWPIPGGAYPLIIEYTAPIARFEQDQDRPSVPWRLLFQYALGVAKAHYRHPDAQVAGQTFERMLAKYKDAQHENRRYFATHDQPREPQVVTDGNGNFSLRV
ncbi:phage adaptor protein [Herbaspirillum chlorophenolicum]|uniref:phage adaptor protein n=1 Tax=Herbaspirillum chlorophenolicum TaxID=211589 RepID=UPI00067D8A95|nr:hypothetical protein [Herbaspirillum chlorophenolicum]